MFTHVKLGSFVRGWPRFALGVQTLQASSSFKLYVHLSLLQTLQTWLQALKPVNHSRHCFSVIIGHFRLKLLYCFEEGGALSAQRHFVTLLLKGLSLSH